MTSAPPSEAAIESVPLAGDYGASAEPEWRRLDWAARERELMVEGRRVRFVELGDGDGDAGFVLVHGLAGHWRHWVETLPRLARLGRVVALDLPGFGASDRLPASEVSLAGFADVAASVCRERGIERAVFVGHSMGGPIALQFASRHPDLARAIVLAAGAVYQFSALLGLRHVVRYARTRPRETAATAAEVVTGALPAPAHARGLVVHRPRPRRLFLAPYVHRPLAIPADVAEVIVGGGGSPGVLPTARAIGRSDPRAGLGEVSCPILAIGGREDRIAPPGDLAAFARDAPAAETVLLDGCGHMLMLERPRAFNDRVADFAASLPD